MKEIGILNRETEEIFTTITDKNEQIYISYAEDIYSEEVVIYAFESNTELFRLKSSSSEATINREFLKRYKVLRPGAVIRLRKEGKINKDLSPKRKIEKTLF